MLRRAATTFLRGNGLRAVSTSSVALEEQIAKLGKEQFLEAWAKVAPSGMNPPDFNSDWMLPKPKAQEEGKEKSTALPSKLTLNFYLPSGEICSGEQVDLALIPAITGDFGVMPGHVPTMSQLRPGVVSIHKEMDKDIKKYFVSGGFAFIHQDSCADICCIEAVEVEQLDPEAVKAGLAEYTAKLGTVQSKGDDYEIAAAQIGVEVYSAMSAALPTQ